MAEPTSAAPKGEAAQAARDFLQISLGIALLSVIDHLTGWVLERLGIQFPSFVLAMVGLFASLSFFRLISPHAVDSIVSWCAPSASFLGRWMALFFVPPLVLLPTHEVPGLKDIVLLLMIGGGGFVATFWVTGTLASRAAVQRIAPYHGVQAAVQKWSRRTVFAVFGTLLALSAALLSFTYSSMVQLIFGVTLSIVAFCTAEALRGELARLGFQIVAAFCHPVLLGAMFIALGWWARGFALDAYLTPVHERLSAGGLLAFLLRPSVVSLAFALDAQRLLIRTQGFALLFATACSAPFSLFFTAAVAGCLGLDPLYARALISRSVTTPVALSMAELLGASGGMTAMIVVLTGVLGALFAAPLGRYFHFDTPFVLGTATGASSHGVGTAGLARESAVAAAFSGITFALIAVFSALLVSSQLVRSWLLALL